MIPLLTREAVRAVDLDAVERLGVPSLVLMENAGLRATRAIVDRFPENLSNVAIIGGPGQNGGDGWVVARQLFNRGFTPCPVLVGRDRNVRGDARTNLDALRNLGVEVPATNRQGFKVVNRALKNATLVVDALFGTGLDRPVRGEYAKAIRQMNRCGAPCVALDLPSGVDANTGNVLETAIRAALTVTFASYKRGLYQFPGAGVAGEVLCASIGIPSPDEADCHLIEPDDIAEWIPPRPLDAHKGTAGDLLIVAGSPGRTGAALLSGLGALRTGAGLVTLAARGAARSALDAKVVELMTAEIPIDPPDSVREVSRLARNRVAAVIGPGLGLDASGIELARVLAEKLPIPAVIDADALTSIGTDLDMLRRARGPRVLTPHPGEAARLLDLSSAEIQKDRYTAAARISERSGCVVVLKGAGSVVASPEGRVRVCGNGTPALGVAGTGDVLSGVIGSMLAALPAFDAASAGVALHAIAGELATESDRGLFAREVADAIPAALESCR
jgi:NAD(P)H-hydrate epimerase